MPCNSESSQGNVLVSATSEVEHIFWKGSGVERFWCVWVGRSKVKFIGR